MRASFRFPGLVLSLALLLAATAELHAEEREPSHSPVIVRAGDEVLAAIEAQDPAGLERLATRPKPNPWLVVDFLLYRAQFDAARTFTSATKDEDREALLAYIERERALPPDTEARRTIVEANRAFGRRDIAAALRLLEGKAGRGLPGIWLINGRATGLRVSGRLEEAQAAYLAAAEAARAVGWRHGIATSLRNAVGIALRREDAASMREIFGRQLALARDRGRRADIAQATIDLGTAMSLAGDARGAIEHLRAGLALARDEGTEVYLAKGATNLGTLLVLEGALEEAEPLLREGLRLHEKLGDEANARRAREGLADLTIERANRRRVEGDLPGAIQLLLELAAGQEAAGDAASLASTLRTLALTQSEHGAHEDATATALRAHAAAERIGDGLGMAAALLVAARVHLSVGRHDEARDAATRARAGAEAAGDAAVAGDARLLLAKVALDLGDPAIASEHAEAVVRSAEKAGGGPLLLRAQNVLGLALARSGHTTRAVALLHRVHEEHARLGSNSALARAAANLGFVYMVRGEYGAAIEWTLRALPVFEKLGLLRDVAMAYSNLGRLYQLVGDPERGLEAIATGARRLEESSDPVLRAAAWINLGAALLETERPEDAREPVLRGLKLAEQAALVPWQISALNNLAAIEANAGHASEADAYVDRALALARDHDLPGKEAETLANQATWLRVRGEHAESLAHARAAAALATEYALPDLVARAERAAGRALLSLGRPADALARFRGSADALDRVVAGLAVTSGDAAGAWDHVLEGGVRAALAVDAPEAMFELVERARAGRLLEGLGGRDALREGAVPPELAELERRATMAVREAHARLGRVRGRGRLDAMRRARKALEAAEQKLFGVVERIQAAQRVDGAVAFARVTTAEALRKLLAPHEAFVVYALTQSDAIAVVVDSEKTRVVDLGSPEAIRDRIMDLLHEGLQAEDTGARLEAVRRAVLDPLKLPGEVRRVLFSPHGATCFVPFQAIVGDRSVAYVPSATVYAVLRGTSHDVGTKVVALGDPDYGAAQGASRPLALRAGALTPLPGTGLEATAVGDTVLLGRQASEAQLRRVLPTQSRWRAVHLACHGLLDEERPLRSALALTPEDSHDGFLSVLEVYRMRVPADLVVLSACESGRGRLSASEGVVGFTGAFMLGGADRVITSLWKVDDEATRALMTRFYALWNPRGEDGDAGARAQGLPAAEALRQAQAFVQAQARWAHPRYWAAWQLWGLPD